jgi:photosystem II stability/assembly factor-like uncharacterized protein
MDAIQRLLPGPLEVQFIAMQDAVNGWSIGGRGGGRDSVFKTTDGGTTWQEVSPPEQHDAGQVYLAMGDFVDAMTAYVLYHPEEQTQPGMAGDLYLWKTVDGGNTWQASAPVRVEFIGSRYGNAWVRFESDGYGWILARYGGAGMHRYPVYLLRSTDGGSYWDILEDPYDGLWLQTCQKTGWDWIAGEVGVITLGFCPYESAEIRLTTDAGESWEAIRLPLPDGFEEEFGLTTCEAQSPLLLSDRELLIASNCPVYEADVEVVHFLYRSQDLGTNWEIQEYPGGVLMALSNNEILALGREIHRSSDDGESWQFVKQVAWDGQFSFVDSELGWAVAHSEDELALVTTRDGGETWQLLEPVLAP